MPVICEPFPIKLVAVTIPTTILGVPVRPCDIVDIPATFAYHEVVETPVKFEPSPTNLVAVTIPTTRFGVPINLCEVDDMPEDVA